MKMKIWLINGQSFKVKKGKGFSESNEWVIFENYLDVLIKIPKTSILFVEFEQGDRSGFYQQK